MNQSPQQIIENAVANAGKKVVNHVAWMLFAGYMAIAAIGWLATGGYKKDSTDGHDRSNMILRTDYGTGCQYLESRTGVLTPRLNTNGQPAGCKAVK